MTNSNTPSAWRANLARISQDKHAALIGVGATLLTGAVLYFNGSYGATTSAGMAVAFIGAAICKDSCIAYAWVARKKPGRVAAGLVGVLAFGISALAAIGAASHGRQDASDPKAQQIAAYDLAAKRAATAEARLAELGKVGTLADANAKASAVLAELNAAIVKRTRNCTVLAPDGSGPSQQRANREECQPFVDANARVAAAAEAERLRADIARHQDVLAKGKPATADAQASTIAAFLALFTVLKGLEGIQAWTNLGVGLGLEIMSSLAWAAFAAAWSAGASATSGFAPSLEAEKMNMPAAAEPIAAERSEPSVVPNYPAAVLSSVRRDGSAPANGSPNRRGPIGGGNGGRRTVRPVKTDVLAELKARLAAGERFASQDEIRGHMFERFGTPVAKSSMSNWLDQWAAAGEIPSRYQEGRRKVVAA